MKNYLEFEKEIKTLEDEMELLKSPGNESISEVDTTKIKLLRESIHMRYHCSPISGRSFIVETSDTPLAGCGMMIFGFLGIRS